MKLEKFSFGMGDRFLHQGRAQLQAVMKAQAAGVAVTPVWNKSNREHQTVKTQPASVREEADAAVKALDYSGPYRVDADHINIQSVDEFVDSHDFFTIDVADAIGQRARESDIESFVANCSQYFGKLDIPDAGVFAVTEDTIRGVANTYLSAVQRAGEVFRHIADKRGEDNLIPEVSMDETKAPQSPLELLFILAALAHEEVPIQTIAPKFTGRFNKGVDYVGDVDRFEKEFNDDLAVIAFAISEFDLPENLKLSVHSGSDKFSIYPAINRSIKRTGAGLHVKTAGTTWLEELIGLAEAGGEGLDIAKNIYAGALIRRDELSAPYATVIDVQDSKLPAAEDVACWDSEKFATTLRHDQSNPNYNPSFRQLLHIGYKIAAEMDERYYSALKQFEPHVARNVTANLWERHLRPLFID